VDENFKQTYDAHSQGAISDNELKLAYEKALAKLADEYTEFIGISFEDLNKMKSEISTLESDLSSLSQNRDDLSRQILLYEEIARVTYQPALVNLNGIFKNAYSLLDGAGESEKLSGIFTEEERAFKILNNALQLSREIENILPSVDSFKNLHDEIGQLSKNLDVLLQKWKSLDDSLKRTSVFADFVKIVENSETLLLSTLNEMKNFAENVLQTVTELTEVQKDYTEKIRKLTALKSNYESAQNLFIEKDSSLIPYRTKMASLITLNEVEYRQQEVRELESLSGRNLSRYELQLRKAREAINGFIFAFQLSENDKRFLKDSINEFVWISNFKTFVDRFESLKSKLPKLFEEMSALIKDFESNYRELLYTRFNGVFVSSSTLDRLYDLVKLDYANQVSGHLGTVVRYAGDLIYDFPLKSATRNAFKKIEGWLYKLGELWKQKPKHHFLRWVLNSVIVAGTVSIITTAVCAVAAYPFSRMRFPGRKYGILSLLIIQMFPGVMYMVALYGLLNLLGKFLPWLGLDSLGGLIFVYLGNIAFNMYLIKGFYDTIPDSMEEAAMIDGATRFQTFYKIVIPLASPILAVVVILTFMGTFNEFVLARIILQDTSNYTYAVGLWTFAVGPYETEWGIFTAAALVGMVPMLVLFLSLQRFLISGLTRGAVKG
ncbi:MAG: maltose/maltodextrin transport system permease protein, partial [Thermotogota bacterium]|nr:maltose/maltodextrin transport system permease protein [Thermotogota bacterium]